MSNPVRPIDSTGPAIMSEVVAMGQSDLTHQQSLECVGLFKGLSHASLQWVQKDCTWQTYAPGEAIFEYLDCSDDVFFVASGEVRVALSRYRRLVAVNVAGSSCHAAADAPAQVRNEPARSSLKCGRRSR